MEIKKKFILNSAAYSQRFNLLVAPDYNPSDLLVRSKLRPVLEAMLAEAHANAKLRGMRLSLGD